MHAIKEMSRQKGSPAGRVSTVRGAERGLRYGSPAGGTRRRINPHRGARMPEHRDPDCTGTWSFERESEGGSPGRVLCTVCGVRHPATLETTLDAMKENLLSVQLIALGLAGRLPS